MQNIEMFIDWLKNQPEIFLKHVAKGNEWMMIICYMFFFLLHHRN